MPTEPTPRPKPGEHVGPMCPACGAWSTHLCTTITRRDHPERKRAEDEFNAALARESESLHAKTKEDQMTTTPAKPAPTEPPVRIATQGALPEYARAGDAGADLRAAEDVWITSSAFRTIATTTRVEIPEGHFGLVAGRSGLGLKHGIALVNGIGVIDAGYRGEIAVGLINHGAQPFHVRKGDRIAQLIITPFVTAHFESAVVLADSERGENGIGSTGVSDAA
ncbi:deoxyuridine 5'-triphosphate nucleotidohydrolase [Microbacterium testaceum]|uniref:dUTP diphosphatase n=1 Tax=Microbacterium TaxID=33882 RepID=UPI002783E1E6|nr:MULTISPECIES: dUTP diphosphatase [Microbacterium]MDQ1113965.1 deoxyuridine 5'-triphosphate nucleotidohydrolase [Microbacterium testaceum]MDR6098929.1 deoxyuridine 5'-triphosphate nucleotidohydrolase [Microbacterium sp. SORGH_AS_0454]